MGWISVNDRLPIDGGRILVAVVGVDSEGMREEAGVFFAIFKKHRFLLLMDDEPAYLTLSGNHIETSWGTKYTVTHWMPLPALPEE